MTKIVVNTIDVNAFLSNFDECVRNYNMGIDTFFNSIANFKGWQGSAADSYLDRVPADKSQYENFGESLAKFRDVIISVVDEFNSTVASSKQ